MERILLIDTSNKYLSIGVVVDGALVYKLQMEAWQRQSEYAMSEIQKALRQLNLKARDLTGIVVGKGPGSYTGIRIALTIGKVLAYALNIPIMALSSLQILAGKSKRCLVLTDARSNRAYVGEYENGVALRKDGIATIDEIKKTKGDLLIVGDRRLVGEKDEEIDIVKNMFDLIAVGTWETDANLILPQYLKDTI